MSTGVWYFADKVDEVKAVLVIIQFSLALGGLVYLKETYANYARLVMTWWIASCCLATLTVFNALLRAYHGSIVNYSDLSSGTLMILVSTGFFLGCYGRPPPVPGGSTEEKTPLKDREMISLPAGTLT